MQSPESTFSGGLSFRISDSFPVEQSAPQRTAHRVRSDIDVHSEEKEYDHEHEHK